MSERAYLPPDIQARMWDMLSGIVEDEAIEIDGETRSQIIEVCLEAGKFDNLQPACVVAGNPVDGFTIYGPFATADEANEWADGTKFDDPWWVTDLMRQEGS